MMPARPLQGFSRNRAEIGFLLPARNAESRLAAAPERELGFAVPTFFGSSSLEVIQLRDFQAVFRLQAGGEGVTFPLHGVDNQVGVSDAMRCR